MGKGVAGYLQEKYQSLIFRILLYFVFSALTVAMVLGWNFVNRVKPRFEQEVLPNLSQYIQYLVNDVGTPPDLDKARDLSRRLPFELRIEGPGVDWSSSANVRPIDQYQLRLAPYPYNSYLISSDHGEDHLLLVEREDYYFLFVVESSFQSGSKSRHGVLFILLGGILILLYLGVRRLFRPLSEISTHLKKIGAGQLDETLDIAGSGELAQLAGGINQMVVEIKSMLEGKAGLLLAISHELRSPITRMRINLELLEDGKTRQALIDDLQEMEQLVSGILETERLDTRHAVLNRTVFNLAEAIEQVISQYFESYRIDSMFAKTVVNMDEVRIRLLVKNIIDNACRYSSDSEKPVVVRLHKFNQELVFSVVDSGPGVDEAELAHITEAFYRTDNARLRKTGGYGLGLYLCWLIVEAHGGRLVIHSAMGEGMTVEAHFPLETNYWIEGTINT
ncbi:MAG: HAMP domain-containing histidine kinase [Gammaproteobacteria bacterium]|nr:HAMP domain-containing histidine kinase [Gammaproteobacteria bacterium]